MSLDLRPYRPGDENAILALFRDTFGREMAEGYWQWRFQRNPVGEQQILLAWEGNTLAAHYAVSPLLMEIDGEVTKTALSMTTMTHPDYRGRGLFVMLAEELYGKLAGEGYAMVWGFPNDRSHRGFVRDLGWKDVAEIPMLRLDPVPAQTALPAEVVEGEEVLAGVDGLWETFRTRARVLLRRNADFLRWRFDAASGNQYRFVGCRNGRSFGAYAAYKVYGEEMDVVDIMVAPDGRAEEPLLAALRAICARERLRAMNCWVPVRDRLHLSLEKHSFKNALPVTYLGARPFRAGVDVTDVRHWHYSMLDSDVF